MIVAFPRLFSYLFFLIYVKKKKKKKKKKKNSFGQSSSMEYLNNKVYAVKTTKVKGHYSGLKKR